jgi:hypothetical protein
MGTGSSLDMPEPARNRVLNLLDGRPVDRPPVIPLIGRFAASINRIPKDVFLSNATQLTTSIQKAHRLFGYDAVLNCPDTTTVGEALGAELEWNAEQEWYETVDPVNRPAGLSDPHDAPEHGRLPTVIDATERLAAELGDDAAVMGAIPGPFLTLDCLTGATTPTAGPEFLDAVSTALTELARAYGHANADVILILERAEAVDTPRWSLAETVERERALLKTLANIADFYRMSTAMAPMGFTGDDLTGLATVDALDAVFVEPGADDSVNIPTDIPVGTGIPTDLDAYSADAMGEMIAERLGNWEDGIIFPASGWELTPDVHPDIVHAAMAAASGTDD